MRRFSALGAALLLSSSVEFLELHGPDGQIAFVNTHEISSLRAPTQRDLHRAFPKNTQCIVVTTNGKFIAVTETCRVIRDQLTRHQE